MLIKSLLLETYCVIMPVVVVSEGGLARSIGQAPIAFVAVFGSNDDAVASIANASSLTRFKCLILD